MKIKWNGHASFTITADDGTVLVTDPYDPSGYGGVLKYDQVRDKADAALISHDHADHNYAEGLSGSPKVLRDSGKVGNIQVKGIGAFHDETKGSERGANRIFSFTVDGIHICFVGDLGHQLSAEQVSNIGPVDLLLLPVGGTFTVDAGGAAQVVKALQTKVVIPMHYKTDKCGLPIATLDPFLDQMPQVKKLNQSEIKISADQIPSAGPEVWVLDHAC